MEADYPVSKRRKTIRVLPVPPPDAPRQEPKLVNNDSIAITESDDDMSGTTLSQSPASLHEKSPRRLETSPSTVMERRVQSILRQQLPPVDLEDMSQQRQFAPEYSAAAHKAMLKEE